MRTRGKGWLQVGDPQRDTLTVIKTEEGELHLEVIRLQECVTATITLDAEERRTLLAWLKEQFPEE